MPQHESSPAWRATTRLESRVARTFYKNFQGGKHMSQVKFNAALYLHMPLV
jgi:hypothetical protein